jgi:tRNA threonylcarbamoyl adenosine modification protein YeaZ
MPQIDRAVSEAGWAKSQIDFIVVGVGPGSFTGIRVAVVTAKTLAQVLHIGLAGVSVLEAYYAEIGPKQPAGIVLSTTSSQYFYGAFGQSDNGQPACAVVPAGCENLAVVLDRLQDIPLLFGDERFVAQSSALDVPTRQLPLIKNIALTQAQLAADRLSFMGLLGDRPEDRDNLKETFPWQNVLPLYLRSPSVTVKKPNAT